MINWCTLPRAGTLAHAQNYAHTHNRTQTETHRDGCALRRSARGAWATYQMCREIFGRWYIWASHPLIHQIHKASAKCWSICHSLSICFNLEGTHRSRLSLLLLILPPLAFYPRSAHAHKHTRAHTHARTDPLLQLITIGYNVPHLPMKDRWIQMTHQTLARRNWSSVWSTGGEIQFIQPMTDSEAVKQTSEVPSLPSRCLLRQGGV